MPVDVFRDTWVRYLGYANEVGEAFRAVVPKTWVVASYKVAFFYVLGDTITKSWNTFRNTSSPIRTLVTAGDVMIWQTVASIAIPGLVINRICYFTNSMLTRHAKKMPWRLRNNITVLVGLASIPIIVGPIDHGTTFLMDNTYRRLCACTQYALNRHGKKMPHRIRTGLTVAVGLTSIPIIIHPIDLGTTVLMDNTYRRMV